MTLAAFIFLTNIVSFAGGYYLSRILAVGGEQE